MHGKCQQCDGHQGLESAALKGTFLEPIDPEDRQKQRQVPKCEQERTEPAAARLGLARIEALAGLRLREEPGLSGRHRIRDKLLMECPLRFRG